MHVPVVLQMGSVRHKVEDWFWPHKVPSGLALELVHVPEEHVPVVMHDVEEVPPHGVPSGTLDPLIHVPE